MACRVGMSTNPEERIQYWKRVEGHTHSAILATGLTYNEATVREQSEALNRGCTHSGGGERVFGPNYSIYHV